MKFIAIIPARYASTRFPGKPLAILGGKPVIQRVYEQVSSVLDEVYVATDDDRIFQAVEAFGGRAVMTSDRHRSGTDRIQEAATTIGTDADVVINVQGDEPFIHPSQIEALCRCFDNPTTQIATLGKPFETIEAVKNPNSPKIVVDNQGFALYFSRSVIPFVRGFDEAEWLSRYPFLKHLGLYAYRREVLREVTNCPCRRWKLPRASSNCAGCRTATAFVWPKQTSRPSASTHQTISSVPNNSCLEECR